MVVIQLSYRIKLVLCVKGLLLHLRVIWGIACIAKSLSNISRLYINVVEFTSYVLEVMLPDTIIIKPDWWSISDAAAAMSGILSINTLVHYAMPQMNNVNLPLKSFNTNQIINLII